MELYSGCTLMAHLQRTDLNPSNLMAHIQRTNLNPSDSELMEELTDEELLKINGGSFWRNLNRWFNRA
jgi:hypothetical protein